MTKNRGRQTDRTLQYTVKEATTLLPFLLDVMSNRGRNSVKSILRRGQVSVDNRTETKYNLDLHPGQIISILTNKAAKRESDLIGLEIIYEDSDLIIVNKEAGLLTIANASERRRTAHHQLMTYVRKQHRQNRVFIVHRLDQDTSGVMVFAKNERAKDELQNNWLKNVKKRGYLALVEGTFEKQSGAITSWLNETKTHHMYSSFKKGNGQYAKTHYKLIQANEEYSLVEAELETGRKNQIRVHMQDLGHRVVGDKKYGAKTNPIKRLGLHAHVLSFIHPRTGELKTFKCPAPKTFWQTSAQK
ncbi:MAG TPA: RluA family pseudouridine synthase [Pseudogracilibacillus sp.]|nr:RluA family pseudouridine synthase [Pseudogracilibacillus sp.]